MRVHSCGKLKLITVSLDRTGLQNCNCGSMDLNLTAKFGDPVMTEPGEIKLENDEAHHQCLVCCRKIEICLDGPENFQINQLHDLLKVFQISVASVEHLFWEELPWSLFCVYCADRIIDAAQLLSRMECLQKDFNVLRKILRRDLLNSWEGKDGFETSAGIDGIRKTLVQCLSSCKVVLEPTSLNCSPEDPLLPEQVSFMGNLYDEFHNTDFVAIDDNFMELLSPVTILTPELTDGSSRRFYQRGCTTSEESGESSEEELESSRINPEAGIFVGHGSQPTENPGDVDKDYNRYEPVITLHECESPSKVNVGGKLGPKLGGRWRKAYPFSCDKCGKGLVSQHAFSVHQARYCGALVEPVRSEGPSGQRFYGNDGKLSAYDCPFCHKKLSRADYSTETGSYIFKCFPDCCDKVMDNFSNLVVHHDACCPSKPVEFQSMTRKSKSSRPPFNNNTSEATETNVSINVNDGFTYDDSKAVICFKCPRCEISLSRLDFLTESGEFVFKCEWDSCDKITSTLSNLAYHHATHCSNSNSRRRKRKLYSKKLKSENDFNISTPEATTTNLHYDEVGKMISYECPFCERKLYREDFYSPEMGIYVFKCFHDYCDKLVDNFSNLITHHKSCCPMTPPNPKRAKKRTAPESNPWTPKQKTGHRVYDSTNKIVSFECSFCQRVMSREAYLTEPGNYVFKCFPDCCDKIVDHFSNLVTHHEAYCKFRPADLQSKTRKSLKVSRFKGRNLADAVTLEATHSETINAESKSNINLLTGTTAAKTGHRVKDDNNKLIRYECPFCEQSLSKEDYFCPESGDYVYKCVPPCCEKIMDNFPNLVFHHEAHCLSKPVEMYSKKIYRKLKERLNLGTPNEIIRVSNGFKINDDHSVIAFDCPRCQKQITLSEFQTESGEFVFKCGWDSCKKIATTFISLAYHHEAHCADRPGKSKTNLPKKLTGRSFVKIE
ncbi:unnamed protein product [Allacma fusca]|uniref:C2H2-type domain-containing protein n=1 Tax=Allacma fusca TaxID=39272 RepID=A0A8J2LEB8_9HEXA|nr:unnamed protein product [Allacma fusca]